MSLPNEQFLELLSEHIASNERLIATLERVETTLPEKTDAVYAEHRERLASITPAPLPDLRPELRRQHESNNLWFTILTGLVVLGTLTCIYLICHVRG